MTVTPEGEVVDHQIAETVICVDKRMSYNGVAKVLAGDAEALEADREFVPMILRMKELSDIIRERRAKRGSIDFDFPETKIILDEKGRPVEIKPYDRNDATKIIEDFMLLANETVAGREGILVTPHLGASTEESEENCAEMAVKEIRDYLENGNIKNSVNYPNCDMGTCVAVGRISLAVSYTHLTLPTT